MKKYVFSLLAIVFMLVTNSPTFAAPAPFDYQGSASELVNAFENNSFAAEEEYIGKRIKITGTVDSIERGPDGNPVVSIKIYKPLDFFSDEGAMQLYNPTDSGNRIICSFGADQKSNVAKLSKNKNTTLIGVCADASKILGFFQIQMTDCVIVTEVNSERKARVDNEQEAQDLLINALQEMGRLKDPLEDIESKDQSELLIAGENLQCWVFSTTFQDNRNYANGYPEIFYAVSKSAEMFQYYPSNFQSRGSWDYLGPIEASSTPEDDFPDLAEAEIIGDNVNVRNAPDTQSKVLFQVSESNGDSLIINKTPVKDSSGQEWYQISYRHMGRTQEFEGTNDDHVYISGNFLKIMPLSEESAMWMNFGATYDFMESE